MSEVLLGRMQGRLLALGDGAGGARVVEVPVGHEHVVQAARADASDLEALGEHAHAQPRVHEDGEVACAHEGGVALAAAAERLDVHGA